MTLHAATQSPCRSLATLALLAAVSCAATAQDAGQAPIADERLAPVAIEGQRHQPVTHLPPRYDVQRTCPDYGEQLKTSLARSLRHETLQRGEMLVRFELQGAEIAQVKTEGGPWHYRSPVRRAVRGFACANDGQSNQQYVFQVVFRQDDEGDDGERIAVRSGPPLIALARVE